MLGSGAVIVIDDRCCMVQLGLRVAQFYMHESCGKCTPCREGTRWMVQILLNAIEEGDGERRATSTCCSTSATGSSASASARSATPRRCRSRATSTSSAPSSRRTSTRAAARSAASRRSRASSRRSTSTRTHPDGGGPGVSAAASRRVVKVTIDGREVEVPKGTGPRRDGGGRGHRDPGLLLRAAARPGRRRLPHVPRRGRGRCRSSRPAAR